VPPRRFAPVGPRKISRAIRKTFGINQTATELGSFAEWLTGWAWDHFATFTFDERWGDTGPSPDRCMSHTKGWLHDLPHSPGYFVCVERGAFGRCHSHALIQPGRGGAHVSSRDLSERWKYGRDNIRDFDAKSGAGFYVSKYIVKAPELWDIDRLDYFPQRTL